MTDSGLALRFDRLSLVSIGDCAWTDESYYL